MTSFTNLSRSLLGYSTRELNGMSEWMLNDRISRHGVEVSHLSKHGAKWASLMALQTLVPGSLPIIASVMALGWTVCAISNYVKGKQLEDIVNKLENKAFAPTELGDTGVMGHAGELLTGASKTLINNVFGYSQAELDLIGTSGGNDTSKTIEKIKTLQNELDGTSILTGMNTSAATATKWALVAAADYVTYGSISAAGVLLAGDAALAANNAVKKGQAQEELSARSTAHLANTSAMKPQM